MRSQTLSLAEKPTNKAEQSAAEPVERRAGAKGNANQHSTGRAQNRATVPQALGAYGKPQQQLRRHTPKVGAVRGNSACTDLCGGGRLVIVVPTAIGQRTAGGVPATIAINATPRGDLAVAAGRSSCSNV